MTPTPEMIEAAAAEIEEGIRQINGGDIGESLAWELRKDPDIIRRIAEATLTAALAVAWRPIESAPRDGTQILVLGEEQGAYSWYVVSYEATDARGDRNFPWETEDGVSYHKDVPDWWMPLPAPPILHKSGCATNNAPAYPPGECGATAASTAAKE